VSGASIATTLFVSSRCAAPTQRLYFRRSRNRRNVGVHRKEDLLQSSHHVFTSYRRRRRPHRRGLRRRGTGELPLTPSREQAGLSRVSRQRFSSHDTGESGSPMSQVILRCYDFPARIPGHLLVSLPGSTLPSSVRVSQLALALPEGRRGPSGPGSMFNRRPNCRLALAWA
jgi:hypothetical protein